MKAVFRAEDEHDILGAYFAGKTGFFVEVGANHPIINSQTYQLEQAGWTGILVEPLSEYVEQIKAARSATVVQAACGSPDQHGGTLTLGVAGALSTLDTARHAKEAIFSEFREVPIVTLDSILEDQAAKAVDFLSIDVEGQEIYVLEGFSIARWKPQLVLLEDHINDSKSHNWLRKHGYKRVRRTGDNGWYVPEAMPFEISAFGRWQIFRKYYLARPLRWLRHRMRKPLNPAAS